MSVHKDAHMSLTLKQETDKLFPNDKITMHNALSRFHPQPPQGYFHTNISELGTLHHFTSTLFFTPLLCPPASCTCPRPSNESHLLSAKRNPYVLLQLD